MQKTLKIPGRINWIGEHTDYNGGFAMPVAIDRYIKIDIQKTELPRLQIHSRGIECILPWGQLFRLIDKSSDQVLDFIKLNRHPDWSVYVFGAAIEFIKETNLNEKACSLSGWHLDISSDLPEGAGLSSSAAFTLGLLEFFSWMTGSTLVDMPKTAQRVEHIYANTPCGLMDQTIIYHGKKDHFLKLEFNHVLQPEPVLLDKALDDYVICVLNSGFTHKLGDTPYKLRKEECIESLDQLNRHFRHNHASLGAYSSEVQFQECFSMHPHAAQQHKLYDLLCKDIFGEEDSQFLAKRACHVIMECLRVKEMENALKAGALETVDRIMTEGHGSLSGYFEVSLPEIDILQEEARSIALLLGRELQTLPILGPRLTGGGFGGSLVCMIHKNILPEWQKAVMESRNLAETYLKIDIMRCAAVNGILAERNG